MILMFYALTGLGLGMVEPIIYSLIGDHLPVEQRTPAIGTIISIAAFAAIIGPPHCKYHLRCRRLALTIPECYPSDSSSQSHFHNNRFVSTLPGHPIP